MNWKIIQTKAGKLSYAACQGNKLIREFDDIAYALIFEDRNEFSNSLNDFLKESKLRVEALQRGEHFENKIERTDSTMFRSLQNKIKKEGANAKTNTNRTNSI